MYKFLKIIISNLFIVLVVLNQNAISKPLPPGSGPGDVPANILILLDSSASMNRKLSSGSGIDNPNDIVEDSAGNLIVGEGNLGFVKILTADNTVDRTFAAGNRNFRGSATDTCTLDGTNNSIVKTINNLGLATNVKGVSGDVIYGADLDSNNGKIVGINTSGKCIEVITYAELGGFRPMAMEVRTINGNDHLFASGRWWGGNDWRKYFYTKNLTTGDSLTCGSNYGGSLGTVIQSGIRLTVDNSGGFVYYNYQGHIHGYALTKTGNNYCPSDTGRDKYYAQGNSNTSHRKATAIQVSPDSDSTIYVTSFDHGVVQKVLLTGDNTLKSVILAGRKRDAENTASAGALSAAEVNLWGPQALFVTSTKVWVSDNKATIQEFDENKFTNALYPNIDTSWQAEYGGKKETRFEGAKEAIKAVVSDSSLTAGANFGYGFWNAGVLGEGKGNINTVGKGYYCHVVDGCDYYRGWNGVHPEGRSQLFNSDSGISVGISKEGAAQIPGALDVTSLEWGTDANAFAQLADEYFRQHQDALNLKGTEADEADCQISYVIVIGDGEWTHGEQAAEKIRLLRQNLGVKTLVVAYGGGINASGLSKFDAMALAGSCDTAGSPDCQARIDADNAQMLKTELASKIQQIIAEKLSFTAPSITATIQEGGSLYQAQFEYIQYGEWRGTISRQSVKADGSLNTESSEENWNAAEKLKNRSNERNIWTTLSDNSYIGNWNNWTTDDQNISDIESLFDLTGNSILDYHNTTSNCSSADGVEDGVNDDVKGLINFVRGIDYFDYDGDCNIIEKRAHLLGDVYNSQLLEVGPPDANSNFTDVNQEAYWRAKNNYQSFVSANQSRQNVIYAGANDGMLHAFNSTTGEEEWAFIPPFIASKLPTIINKAYDGKFAGDPGGTNPIFGVDGSPVVHDMYIQGLNADGAYEQGKSWRTILMIPYGRGGAGFSVLDVTNPIINGNQGPLHMYSVFNDHINSKVLVADNTGQIAEYQYTQATINISNSEEAKIASENQNTADAADSDTCEVDNSCTQQDAIATCQTNALASGSFRANGTAACFTGSTFVFDIEVPSDGAGNVSQDDLVVTEIINGDKVKINFASAKMVDGFLKVDFGAEKTFNVGTGNASTNQIILQTSCSSVGTDPVGYDYSQLGETWSTPRIFRIPAIEGDANINDDKYVAVMGGGMGNTFVCSGSNVFLVNLEDLENPGSIFGAVVNQGAISIVDTDTSDIANALPTTPVVITPDSTRGVPWRGAMVYFNDLEGKITKINLTNQTINNAKLYDQTTLFKLNATVENGRYSYKSMDATIGKDTNNFWLFGGTGDFQRIGDRSNKMDNILYGIKDEEFPYFKHLNEVNVPKQSDGNFEEEAKKGADAANHINDANVCVDTTDATGVVCLPGPNDQAWVIKLDPNQPKRFRKVSAPPTVYKGNVFYPIYEPPVGNKCNIGKAFICSADDECGTNNSSELGAVIAGEDCLFVRRGILSELTIFADTLYGNVAGPAEQEDTLFILSTNAGEVTTYRRSWRENY